jgi:hypothetical protein
MFNLLGLLEKGVDWTLFGERGDQGKKLTKIGELVLMETRAC